MKHFLALSDFSADELLALLARADELKSAWSGSTMPKILQRKRAALWFYGQGFRNRIAFELGAKAMGATVAYIPGELGVHEPLEDIAGYLSNWFSFAVIRCKNHEDLYQVAASSSIPIINARTDKSHPCEIMGDLHFMQGQRGSIDGLKVAFVGEVTNLAFSWLEAAQVFPIQVTQVCPPGYEASDSLLESLRNNAKGEILVTNDLDAALKSTDVIYTDCWPKATTAEEKPKIETAFLPYQIQLRHLANLTLRGAFLPCPPVTRGQEVTAEAMLSPFCKNFEAKDDLLHVQNAIMEMVVGSA
jgi:ornithine carbamoyltransferase